MRTKSKKGKKLIKQRHNRELMRLSQNRVHLKNVQNFVGFVVEITPERDIAKVQTHGSLISDDPLFYTYIEQITLIFLKDSFVNAIHEFLLLIHDDYSADIYINNIPKQILMMAKRDLKKGEIVRKNDIADIGEICFKGINIKNTDKVIYCFKVGWKFGLFFDLNRDDALNVNTMQVELGALYRHLSFQYVYDVLDSESHFNLILKDGWFPFIGIIGSEFKEINNAYQKLPNPEIRINELVKAFDQNRFEQITNKWWKKELFLEKKDILESGIDSYLRFDDKGFIACIKILLPEIEGIIRLHYFEETGKGNDVRVHDLLGHILEKGRNKTGSDLSLFFPKAFFKYLSECIFPRFDLEKGDISLSRHTSSHGIAKVEEYSQHRALQLILILDQIYFYI